MIHMSKNTVIDDEDISSENHTKCDSEKYQNHEKLNRKHSSSDSGLDNSSNNHISTTSINFFNENEDNDSIIESSDDDVISEYEFDEKYNNDIKKIVSSSKSKVDATIIDSLGGNICINNLSINKSAGVTIGNNIQYVVEQYYPSSSNINKNLDSKNSERSVSKKEEKSSSFKQRFIEYFKVRKKIVYLGIITILAIIISCTVLILILNKNDENNENYITREEWGAKPAKQLIADTTLPATIIVICHSGIGINSDNHDICEILVRNVQISALNSIYPKYADIPYNFLACGDGNIYEGRGWNKQTAAYDNVRNVSISIAFIGNYDKIYPDEKTVTTVRDFIASGVTSKKIISKYRLFAHSTWELTKSPGKNLYNEIINWDHFTTEKFD